MASAKDIYEAKVYAANIYAAGVFRGVGVAAPPASQRALTAYMLRSAENAQQTLTGAEGVRETLAGAENATITLPRQ